MGDPLAVLILLSILLAWLVVIGVSVWGAVRCLWFEEFLASLKILLVLPLCYGAHKLFWIMFNSIANPQNVPGDHPLEYAMPPLYLSGAALVSYFVIRHVRWLTTPPGDNVDDDSRRRWFADWRPADLKRKVAGVVLIVIGAGVMAASFVLSGVLFVVVGVSLLMNVRIWRR